jgi:hypothetical protein
MCNNKIDVELTRVEFSITSNDELTREDIKRILSKNVKSLFDQHKFDIDDIDVDVETFMGIGIEYEYFISVSI